MTLEQMNDPVYVAVMKGLNRGTLSRPAARDALESVLWTSDEIKAAFVLLDSRGIGPET